MYYLSKIIDKSFEEAISLVTNALKKEGLGIHAEIDVQASFKKKLNVDFRKYKIIAACHPKIAYQIIQADDKAGTLFPCSLIVQEQSNGKVEISSVNPTAMFQAINNPEVKKVASEANQIMQAVIAHLN